MKRVTAIFGLFTIYYLLFTINTVFAQEITGLPVQETSTTIVGKGTGGTPAPTSPPGPGPLPIPECGLLDVNINFRLKQDFGITIKEGAPPTWVRGGTFPAENANCITKKGIYKTFAIATQSYKYKNKLTSRPFTIQFFYSDSMARERRNTGLTNYGYLIQLINGGISYNRSDYKSPYFYSPATWITHESAHILQQRDSSLENKFPDLRWLGSDHRSRDTDCYEYRSYQAGWIFKTYSKTADVGSATRESMAEAIALYVYNHKNPGYAEIKNFKRECPDTYEWVKENIYDPKEFN